MPEPSHPAGNIYRTSCVSTENGVLVASGYVSAYIKTVYIFRDKKWSTVGELQKVLMISIIIIFITTYLRLATQEL